ncbi:MAG TPA: sugar ABC transporter permease [Anaerolineales bacterium]
MSTAEVTTTRPQSMKRSWQRQLEPVLYIAPAFLVLVIILVYPLGYSFWLTFHQWTLRDFIRGVPWVGLQNYIALFSNPDFLNSLRVTFIFVISAIAIEFTLGMGLALLLNHDLKGKGFIRSMILLPMMCTNVVIGLTWRLLFNYNFGIINFYLTQVGLSPVEWLSVPNLAMVSVIIVDVWNTTSFVALMLLAGLQSLPEEPFEAAKIDGASAWQTFSYITLPLLRQSILVALLWRLIDTFRIFDVVYLLTAGGPAHATETVSIYVYNYGFKSFNLGYASAATYIMIMIMLAIAGLLARNIGRSSVDL